MTDLAPEEIGSLMNAISEAGQALQVSGPPASPWDLTNPARDLQDPMPALESAHEAVAERFATALSGRTRRRLRVVPSAVQQRSAEDLVSLTTPPDIVCVLETPNGVQPLLVVDRELAEQLLVAGLGLAASTFSDDNNELTRLERLVLERLLSLFIAPLVNGYREVHPLKIGALRIESDPRLLRVDPKELLLLSAFDVDGDLKGRLSLVMPYSQVASAKERLITRPRKVTRDPAAKKALRAALIGLPVDVRVVLGCARTSIKHTDQLKPGEVIPLDSLESTPLVLTVNGQPKLTGRPTSSDGHLALQIERIVSSTSTEEFFMSDPNLEARTPDIPDIPEPDARVQLLDVPVKVSVEFGRTSAAIADVMNWTVGGIVKLDKVAGEPLDVLLNGRLVGRGEAVVIGERFGVRITHIVGGPSAEGENS